MASTTVSQFITWNKGKVYIGNLQSQKVARNV